MSSTNTPNQKAKSNGLGAGHIIAIVLGVILALTGIGSLLGAGALGWANATQRDSQGYFSTSTDRFASSAYAITSDRIDLNSGAGPGEWGEWFTNNDNIATVRIRAKTSTNVFVGIGPQTDVDRYLAGVAHDEVTKVNYRPFKATYRRSPGTATPALPASQTFWVAKNNGESANTLTWVPTQGAWAVVVMNADATPVVKADIALGIRVTVLGWIIGALSIGGAVALLLGVALIIIGASRSQRASDRGEQGSAGTPFVRPAGLLEHLTPRSSPVRLEGHLTEPLSRWLWLVKWLLLIPHVIVLFFLWTAFGVLTIVAGIAIVFTGRYPRSLFDFNVGVLRWTWRVQFYGPGAYGTDIYPPFSLAPMAYPATLEIDYPDHLSRVLVFVKSWLLAIPHLIIIAIFSAGWSWNRNSSNGFWRTTQLGYPGGLIGICATIGGIVLLIRRAYPKGLFDFVIGMNRWVYRVVAYVALMTDEYPPFHFDGGPTEPNSNHPSPPKSDPSANAIDESQPNLVGASA